MEINIQALARGKYNRSFERLIAKVTGKRYLGFQCGVGWIIESPALHDKRSCAGKVAALDYGPENAFSSPPWNLGQSAVLAAIGTRNRSHHSPPKGHFSPLPFPYQFGHRPWRNCSWARHECEWPVIAADGPIRPARPGRRHGRERWSSRGNRLRRRRRELYMQSREPTPAETASRS
jgi:hypothetical protein